jgi:hypothetical protein
MKDVIKQLAELNYIELAIELGIALCFFAFFAGCARGCYHNGPGHDCVGEHTHIETSHTVGK